jgi:lysine biosynthesis protein LysW
MWECSHCGTENDLDPDTEEEQFIECLECGFEYEVTVLDPLTFKTLAVAVDVDGDASDPTDASEDDDDDHHVDDD